MSCVSNSQRGLLEGNENPEFYIRKEDNNRINAAIEKQTKVDYVSYIYNFKM